jgi:NDP-sugar pyrophosphorylase family protein
MMPLTAERPKPLIPVAGKAILARILDGVRAAGVTEAIIVVGYRGEMIEAAFGDGAALGMRLVYRTQDPPDGTGGALRLVADLCGDAPFLLHWGDILIAPGNYPVLLNSFRPDDAALLGVNPMDDPAAGAAVYLDGDRVTRIVEKPAPGTSTTRWNNAGVMALSAQVWPYVRALTPSPRGEYEVTDALHALIRDGARVRAHPLAGLWSDVGTPETVAALDADPRLAG